MTANAAVIAIAAATAAHSPIAGLPVAYAAAIAAKAPLSITPSIPILITPLSSTSNSPSAASSSGAAMLIVELRNASSIGASWGHFLCRGRLAAAAAPFLQRGRVEGKEHEDHQSLGRLDQDRRD